MKFAAIDFETANNSPDSACQIGVAFVEDGKIVDRYESLIRPKRMFFSQRCVAVHGIRPKDVLSAPQWDEVWDELGPRLKEHVLVAHNAGFDLRVLCSTLAAFDLSCPTLRYSCTRLIARRTWPGRRSYGLMPTATALGIEFQHHDALEDAMACANIALASAAQIDAYCWDSLEAKLGLTAGMVRYGVLQNPRTRRKRKSDVQQGDDPLSRLNSPNAVASSGLDWVLSAIGDSQPLKQRNVVLCGTLMDFDHADSCLLLKSLGANVQPKMNLMTHYLIAGKTADAEREASIASHPPVQKGELQHDPSQKQKSALQRDSSFPMEQWLYEAKQRQEDGQPLQVLSHRQFMRLLPNSQAIIQSLMAGSN